MSLQQLWNFSSLLRPERWGCDRKQMFEKRCSWKAMIDQRDSSVCVFWDLNTYYKNASACVTVTLDKGHLSCCILHIIYSHENNWQSFPYPEGLPVRRLSFVQWFRSSVLQSRYPEPECYHCKQREKHSVLSHVVKCLSLYLYTSFYQCPQAEKMTGEAATSCR